MGRNLTEVYAKVASLSLLESHAQKALQQWRVKQEPDFPGLR